MNMKTIHKSLIALAASLLLVPAAVAQPYLVNEESGFGFNKYLKSKTPNAQGEYTIRIENFATGEVKLEKKSTPSDIILVLDMSGSMLADYVLPETLKPMADQLILEKGTATTGLVEYQPGYLKQDTGNSGSAGRALNVANPPQNNSTIGSLFYSGSYTRWIKYNGEYCKVTRTELKRTINGATAYCLYLTFTQNNQKYYLFGKETDADKGIHPFTSESEIPNNHMVTKGGHKTLWQGQLYRYPTRLEALRESVQAFITKIAENDRDEVKPFLSNGQTKGNQISIVKFSGDGYFSGWPSGATDPAVVPSAEALQKALTERNNNKETSVVKKFTELTDANAALITSNITALQNTIDRKTGMQAESNTPIDCGANIARLLFLDLDRQGLKPLDESGKIQVRNRTVIFFTDGDPVKGKNSFCQLTHEALDYGVALKKTGKNEINSKIFTIGLNPSKNSLPFLQRLSSNYPDAVQTVTASGDDGAAKYANYVGDPIPEYDEVHDPEHQNPLRIFYSDAATTDIKKIFDSIAEYAGGGASTANSSSLTAIDLVSKSFTLPKNADVSRIKVYTAPCVGTTGETWTDKDGVVHDYLAFADKEKDEILAKGRKPVGVIWLAKFDEEGKPIVDPVTKEQVWEKKENYDIDANITVSIDKEKNTVNVGGFNYGEMWCGYDADPNHDNTEEFDKADYPETYKEGYRGFKLIIEFPIVVKDGALGGPAVITNEEGSGLYQVAEDGTVLDRLYQYPLPDLPIPVNIWIEKRGLRKNESATFTVLKKPVGSDDSAYTFFTRVNLIGQGEDTPVVHKLLNLNPSFYYKIAEEGWSWTYSPKAQAYTTEDPEVTNPIVIENKYDDPDPKHAEAVARNEMKKKAN